MILNLLLSILNIKRKQVSRLLSELGVLRIIILFAFYCFYQFYLFNVKELHAFFVSAALLSLLSVAQTNRKDEKILLQLLDYPFVYYLIENLIWVILFTWGLLFSETMYIYPFIIIPPLLSSFLSTNKSIENQGFVVPIPFLKSEYDWKAGMRNGGSWGIIASFVLSTLGVLRFEFLLVAIIVSSITAIGFYNQNEPRSLLYAVGESPQEFLKRKTINMMKLYSFINLFALLIGVVLYTPLFFIVFYLFVAATLILFIMILHKYMTYEPNTVFKANSLPIVFYYFSCFIPFLLPLSIFVAIRSWRRAVNQMSYYF